MSYYLNHLSWLPSLNRPWEVKSISLLLDLRTFQYPLQRQDRLLQHQAVNHLVYSIPRLQRFILIIKLTNDPTLRR